MKEAENVFLTCGWEYGLECVGGLRSCEKFKVHFAFAIRHCLTPSHPPTHPCMEYFRVGISLCVFSLTSLPKLECDFFCWNQLLIMYSFLPVFLDSVSLSWPVLVLLYLSFCVNKGQAACSAWHNSLLCVRNVFNIFSVTMCTVIGQFGMPYSIEQPLKI